MTAILFILLFVFLFSGIPVYIAMAFSSAIFMDMTSVNIGVEMLAQRMFAGVNKFSMIAIPCFIFAANVMKEGGLSKRIIDLANAMFGHKRGGLGIATVVACMFFWCSLWIKSRNRCCYRRNSISGSSGKRL